MCWKWITFFLSVKPKREFAGRWSHTVWTEEYKRDQVPEKSELEMRFIVMALRGITVIHLTRKLILTRSDRSSTKHRLLPWIAVL